ncbi:MAG: D-alanyl-D-alanine carboxypeptidase/D-alanyl-D-alanine-endopeptidase [Propionibacteriaceae bacterium]|nr:D-alanyl-D-alanine carboxypeptidase/D-alanyl-D-alanine-endopeptidase [Propionibacteriaceae bacterium]
MPEQQRKNASTVFRGCFCLLTSLALLGGCATANEPVQQTRSASPGDIQVVESMVSPSIPPNPDVLAKQVEKVSAKSLKSTGYAVFDTQGRQFAAKNDKAMVPASTMKILTAMAAIDVLGSAKTFTTKVVSAGKGKITLVGAGDPYLTIKKSKVPAQLASIEALANATAKALKAKGVKKVALTYDASLFSGAAYSPSWDKKWKPYTARIKSLVVNSGKSTGWRADTDPAKAAAGAFAKQLKKKGVKVSSVKPAKAPANAAEVAQVTSATVGTMVRRLLRYSDNVAAEVLARHVALARGKAGSFNGASRALSDWLAEHGLWTGDMKIDGGSGLTPKARIKPSTLAKALGMVLADPVYLDVSGGLPVAGKNGTLKKRFSDKTEKAGRNVVHAKTGSLKAATSLAGFVKTKDGAMLAFAFLAAHDGHHEKAANHWLDRSATVLASCGCS